MKDFFKIVGFILIVLLGSLSIALNISYLLQPTTTVAEYAYMEGQRDYMNGEIKIIKTDGNYEDYEWLKSPWNDEDVPRYQKLSDYMRRLQ